MPPDTLTTTAQVPATLADFTNPRLIVPELRGKDVAAIIRELSEMLRQEERVPDARSLCEAALRRELLVSTDTEAGMAFPHARLAELEGVSFALGRSSEPLAWGARAIASVRLVFLIAVPVDDSTRYLSLISGLVRLAKDPDRVGRIHAAANAVQIFDVLRQVTLRTSLK